MKSKAPKSKKGVDIVVIGSEPAEGFDFTKSRVSLIRAYSWYNYFYGNREAKQFLMEYLAKSDDETLKQNVSEVRESFISTTVGWIARMKMRECKLPKETLDFFEGKLSDYREGFTITAFGRSDTETLEKVTWGAAKVIATLAENIKAQDYDPGIYGIISKLSMTDTRKVSNWVKAQKFSEDIENFYLKEVQEVLARKEAPVEEPSEEITVVAVEKPVRKARARKAISPEKLTKNVKYVKRNDEFNISSLEPAKMIGANALWLYNEHTRQIIYAESKNGFGLRGLQLLNVEDGAQVKRLRKPKEFLAEFMGCTQARKKKLFEALTTTPYNFNGRFNKKMLILSKA